MTLWMSFDEEDTLFPVLVSFLPRVVLTHYCNWRGLIPFLQ